MTDQGGEDTFIYPLAGRELVFLKTSPAQLTMMRRYVEVLKNSITKAEAAGDTAAAMAAAQKIDEVAWTAVESRFTSEADLDFVRMEVIAGRVTEAQLYRILANGQGSEAAAEDDADVVKKQRTVRGNAGKNASKAAKKAAPTPRAKR